jgi:hypothetical protein
MNKIATNTVRASAVALIALIALGCQSTKPLEEVRALAQKADAAAAAAQSTANSAAASATAANNTANAAKSSADNAQRTANEALTAAKTAQTGVDATNEKIDRMFKKSVAK